MAELSNEQYLENKPAKKKFTIIIPVYNEEQSVKETIAKCHQIMTGINEEYEIIAVNDGSKDKSYSILKEIDNIILIDNPYNLGYGASIKKGIKQAKGEWIIITDADGTYPIDKIPELLEHIPRYDMVVGNRQTDNDYLGRRPAKWLLKKLASFLVGRNIPDLNSGLRVFRADIAQEFMHLFPSGFSLTSTITLACLSSDYTVKYIDIPYFSRVGHSSIKPTHFFSFLNLIIKMFLYFKPLRMLSPVAVAVLVVGVLRTMRDISNQGYIGSLAIIFIMTSFFIFLMAFITEAVVRSK